MSTIVPTSELAQVLNRAAAGLFKSDLQYNRDVAEWLARTAHLVVAVPPEANPRDVALLHHDALRVARAYLGEPA